MSLKVNIDGTWKNVSSPHGKISGTWKQAKAVYSKDSGAWKSSYLESGYADRAFFSENSEIVTPSIYTVKVQADGKIITGSTQGELVRYFSNGTLDSSFNNNIGTGGNGSISSIAIQPDNKIIVVGSFNTWNGANVKYIVRLNSDGTRDANFNDSMGTGANNPIYSVAINSSGKIMLGGAFASWNNITRRNFISLNSDGTEYTSFMNNVGNGAAASSTVWSVIVTPEDKVVVGGYFTSWNGSSSAKFIVMLNSDGTRDQGFSTAVGSGPNTTIAALAMQSGSIIAAGGFTTWNGATVNRVVRISTTGTRDTTFTTNIASGPNGAPQNTNGILVQSNNKIIFLGSFGTWNGATVGRIARINSDGSADTTFNSAFSVGFDNISNCAAELSTGEILVGGGFKSINNDVYIGKVAINSNLSLSTTLFYQTKYGFDDYITGITTQPDGKIIVAGNFSSYNRVKLQGIIRFNSDYSVDTTFVSNFNAQNQFAPGIPKVASDGKLYFFGYINTWGGIAAAGVVRLNSNGTLDTRFSGISGIDVYSTNAIDFQSDGKILAAGNYYVQSTGLYRVIARFNTDGTMDSTFTGPSIDYSYGANDVKVLSNGNILVAGYFYINGYTDVIYLYVLSSTGAVNSSFNSSTGTNGSINKISLQSDGKILLGGTFSNFAGTSKFGIVRLNTNYTIDTAFNIGSGPNAEVNNLFQTPDGSVIVHSTYATNFNNVVGYGVYKLSSTGSVDTVFANNNSTSLNTTVRGIAQLPNSDIMFIVGGFTSYEGVKTMKYILRLPVK